MAVEIFEKNKYPMPVTTTISAIFVEYMLENNLNKVKLSKILEVPNATMSEL